MTNPTPPKKPEDLAEAMRELKQLRDEVARAEASTRKRSQRPRYPRDRGDNDVEEKANTDKQ